MNTMSHISTGTDSFQAWRTPKAIAQQLIAEYDCVIDVAADAENSLCATYFDEECDALSQDWLVPAGSVWCNPPYRNTGKWIKKAIYEVRVARQCNRAVFLVPASVGTLWFTDALRSTEIHLFDTRIAFDLPPMEDLTPALQLKLYKTNGLKKDQPGGGNALLVIDREGLIGVTAIRSAKTGRVIFDMTDGSFPDAQPSAEGTL